MSQTESGSAAAGSVLGFSDAAEFLSEYLLCRESAELRAAKQFCLLRMKPDQPEVKTLKTQK